MALEENISFPAAEQLPQSVRDLQMAIGAMPIGASWTDLSNRKILFVNRKFTQMFGYLVEDLTAIEDWVEHLYPFPEDRKLVTDGWLAPLAGQAGEPVEAPPIQVRIRCKDGTVKNILNGAVVHPESQWSLATFVEIDERESHELRLQAAQREAAENEAIYRLLLDHAPEMIVLLPFEESRRYVSSAVEKITGLTPAEYLSAKPLNTFHPEDRPMAMQVLERLKRGQLQQSIRYRIVQKGGGYRWVDAKITGYTDPVTQQTLGYIATVRDVAEEVEREERMASEHRTLSEVAIRDDLTGIANRRAFNQAISGEVSRHTRASRDLSLLMVDVDYFKRYNDLYGHLAGDACLRTVAATLRKSVRREADLVARYGGEEFVVLMPSTEISGAELVAGYILHAVRNLKIAHAESPHRVVTVSIGIASWPAGRPFAPEQLIERADRALYQAKEQGRNRYKLG